MRAHDRVMCLLLAVLVPLPALAATYTVGPSGRQYTQLAAVFADNDLEPGDVVEVDGNAAYEGGIVVGDDDGGGADRPVVIRWRREAGATRPVLKGGVHTIKFSQSNHLLFEGFEVRGGSNSCIFSEAHDITVRDVVVHACPGHGILTADQLSGSFTLEYSEVHDAGASSNRHPLYIQSDEVAYPDAVFRLRFNYIHDGNGGNLVKVRHQRSEIHYNWLEGSVYQALELIGPDCWEQQKGWSTELRREDAELVGNVIIQSGEWPNAIRMGGDLNGRSQGRVRLVNNTIVFNRPGPANAVLVQLGAGSLEMHNNVVFQTGGEAPAIVRENQVEDTPEPCGPASSLAWSAGRKVAGSNNWVQDDASLVPAEWLGTLRGSDPGIGEVPRDLLRPRQDSELRGRANLTPAAPAAFAFPRPLLVPAYEPPLQSRSPAGQERPRPPGALDIGALGAVAGAATSDAAAPRKFRKSIAVGERPRFRKTRPGDAVH